MIIFFWLFLKKRISCLIPLSKEILALKNRLNKIYSKHTKKSEEEIKRTLERDNFMTPSEAKAFGLIDGVVEKRSWSTTFGWWDQLLLDKFKH